ncbi:MAG: hypothetical protein EP330_00300 [Deltaproteobacteria bacterium]|nr:MAG: hypothetical protein EP330_00300 [Deltaproteobacteria bacterium]
MLWLALLTPAQAVETIPTDELVAYLEEVREGIGAEKLAIGYSGYSNQERLAPVLDPIDFIVAKRLPSQGEPEKLMKGLMKKAKSACGFVVSGGGRNTTLHAVGECKPEQTEEEAWTASCREQGLVKQYPDGDVSRIELLRPTLPEGLDKDAWDTAVADLASAFAACGASEGELPDEARLTVKMTWSAEGVPAWGATTPGGAPAHLAACAEKITSCLPDLPAAEGPRVINQVIRVVPAAGEEAPPEAPAEEEAATETPAED